MSKYLVTVTALADVWTYVVVDADDPREAREKAVLEIQRDGMEWSKGEHPPRLLDATRVELLARQEQGAGDKRSSDREGGLLAAAS
jgi:hypothetical protein